MTKKRNIAILGGSFNPITKGHIQIAKYVLGNTDVDEIWLTPCYSHMWSKELESPIRRFVMCTLAERDLANIITCNFEISSKMTTGTFDFLSEIIATWSDINFSYIIGMDNANNFDHWRRSEDIKRLVRMIVVSRQGVDLLASNKWFNEPPHICLNASEAIMDVSSTLVRNMIEDNQLKDLNKYIDPLVIQYIQEKGLYGYGKDAQ